MKRKLISMGLAALMVSCLIVPVSAASDKTVAVNLTADAPAFNVTLPTSIPIHISKTGVVSCPTNLKIVNYSAGPVEVETISMKEGGWKLTNFNGGNSGLLDALGINGKKYGFQLEVNGNTAATATDGNQTLAHDSSLWVIRGGGTSARIGCKAIASAVEVGETNTAVGSVSFTIKLTDKAVPDYSDPLMHNNVIPTGGTYTQGGNAYNAGTAFPVIADGDTYAFGDYTYTYHESAGAGYAIGWAANTVSDTSKASYGDILVEINGVAITSLPQTFACCASMTTAPEIPSSVTVLNGTFSGCTVLATAPAIPYGVTDMTGAFAGCTALTEAPSLPATVTVLDTAFEGCTALTGTIVINTDPTSYTDCFKDTTQPIKLSGASTLLSSIAATGNNSNVTIPA